MQDKTRLALYDALEAGALNDRQRLAAFEALENNTPDEKLGDLLGSVRFTSLASNKNLGQLADERMGRDRENFDYTSGADGKLRSLMSFGETEQDREAILASLVGSDGYVRDPSGQLALTEKGQRERGMEPIGKNLVIEDEGFSMRDISEFAGILPETIGSIGGAIAGGGLTFGVGSVAGAAGGAAAGQAIEEALEKMLGVQTQSLGEVAKDVAIEGAIGAGGELLGAAVMAAGRGVVGAGRAAGRAVAARSPAQELAADRLSRMESMVGRGYVPSLEAMGGPKPAAFAQKFFENAGKVDTRIKTNTNQALLDKEAFLAGIKGDPASALAEDVMWYAPGQFSKLTTKRNDAQKSILKAVDDGINLISKSLDENVDLNTTSLGRITEAFAKFGDVSKDNFTRIDDMLSQIQKPVTLSNGTQVMKSGGEYKIFDTRTLQAPLNDYMAEMRNLADPAAQQIDIFLRGAKGNASFKEMANLRKSINDSLYFGGNVSTKARPILENIRGQIDTMMDGTNILDDIRVNTVGLTADEKQIIKAAADQRNFAIKEFRKGMSRFDDLSKFGIIRSVRDLQAFDGYEPRAVADRFFDKAIKNNSPERLNAVLGAVDNPNELQDMFARRFLDDILENAGRDPINPSSFNGKTFEKAINKLGTTGPALFGKEWGQVKKLAREIGKANAKDTISVDDIRRVTEAAGSETSIVRSMQDMLAAQNQLNDALKTSVIKDIQSGKFENYDSVVRALTNPKLTQDEVLKIMKFFDNNPQLKQNMKDVVLQDILSVVDDQIFANPKSAGSLKEAVSKYKPGSLKAILGDDTANALSGFADDLIDLGDVGKEGAIAASSIWANFLKHPINTLGAVTRFKFLAKAMGNPTTAKLYLRARRAANGNPEMEGNAMISAINQAMIDEGVDVGGAASKAVKIAGGVGTVLGQAGRANRQTVPRALGLGSFEQPGQTRTNVQRPRTEIPQIDIPDVSIPASSNQPMGPIQQLQRNVQSEIRRRAKENPAVAATLLGGLGSAGLL
ncbi:MAG: hypothetical protein VW715_10930 [Rhodospirillales bacterium]